MAAEAIYALLKLHQSEQCRQQRMNGLWAEVKDTVNLVQMLETGLLTLTVA
ncbi:hypothetical protein [Tardiphaga sp.]|uniref:hypothetical protein n=1 Tax=Tardiphaga sp. TaxID=1926292 RepID=UPI003529F2E7